MPDGSHRLGSVGFNTDFNSRENIFRSPLRYVSAIGSHFPKNDPPFVGVSEPTVDLYRRRDAREEIWA